MAVKLSEDILDEICGLIKDVTHFTEEDENFHLCYKYALSNVCSHRFLSVNRHVIKQSFDNLALRFRVHGHTTNAQRLEKLVSDFVNHPAFKDHPQSDLQWSILSVLISMTGVPTNIETEVAAKSEDEPFDWAAYLREGDVDIHYSSTDTDTDDDWDLSEPEAQEELLSVASTNDEASGRHVPTVPLSTCASINTAAKCDQIKQCLLSKEWLAHNVQHSWWSSSSISDPGCSYSRINVAHLWNKCVSQNGSDTLGTEWVNTLSEYKVVREVLFMLQWPVDMRVFVRIDGRFCVRPDITIPSLTQRMFSQFLQEMCEYFDMLKELLDFSGSVRSASQASEGRLPPLTYKAYCILAVDVHITRLQEAAVRVEADVRKQEKPHTLLSVKRDLQPFLDDLRTLYILHQQATIFPWQNFPNWLCATCMLSVIYEALETAVDDHVASMMLAIFMKVFSPYLRIANTWLTGGQLEDVCEEFIIAKTGCASDTTCLDEGFEVRQFENALIEKGVVPAPVLQAFGHRVLQAGKTMEFLHKMNRVAEIRKQPEPCGELFVKLSSDSSMLSVVLTERIIATVNEIQDGSDDAGSSTGSDDDFKSASDESKCNLARFEFPEHVRRLGDPYLLAAFGYSFHADSQSEALLSAYTYKLEDSAETKVFKRLDRLEVVAMLPLRQLLQRQLEQLIDECHSAACKVVRKILLVELLLPTHFSLVRHIVLNEAGDIMHNFAASLFAQLEHGFLNTYALSNNLENCVDERFPEYSLRFAVTECVDKEAVAELCSNVSQLEALDLKPVLFKAVDAMAIINKVQILYKVDWPISLFLDDANMKCYNKVFRFLLEVRWALHLLNHLWLTELRGPAACRRRLQLLRFWHTHTLGSVHAYLMGQVLQSESFQLQGILDEARDLDSFLEAHNNYVKTIYRKCFRPSKLDFIVCGVHQLVAQAYVLKACWGSAVSAAVLDSLESMYNHTHCMMTVVLRLHVEEEFDSELEGLYSALDDRIPFPETRL